MARARSYRTTGSEPGNGPALRAGKGSLLVMLLWFLSLLIAPVFGYFLTGMAGWVNSGNWRTMMTIRVVACFVWPVCTAMIHGLVNARTEGKWNYKNTLTFMVFSSYGIWPAFNAYRDLRTGPEQVELVVADKEIEAHRSKRRQYSTYEVFLSDGGSYHVSEGVYDKVGKGESCLATRLPHTDILLDLQPI